MDGPARIPTKPLPEYTTLAHRQGLISPSDSMTYLPVTQHHFLNSSKTITMLIKISLLTSLLVLVVEATFILRLPPALGVGNAINGFGPCSGYFDLSNQYNSVAEFPTEGYPILLNTTDLQSTFWYRASLLTKPYSNTTVLEWHYLLPPVTQTGVGEFCLPTVPGKKEWVGLDALVQVIQESSGGIFYQVCIFVDSSEGSSNMCSA